MEHDIFKRQFSTSIIVVVVVIVVASIALYVLSSRMSDVADAIVAARELTASQAAQFQALASLKEDALVAAKYQAAMDQLLPSQSALITFPSQVESLGRADGVSTSFSFEGIPVPSGVNGPGTLSFSLDVSGTQAHILAFMKDFEASAPILLSSLDTVSITGDSANYTMTARGKVFFK
jgi:hypothetical protein